MTMKLILAVWLLIISIGLLATIKQIFNPAPPTGRMVHVCLYSHDDQVMCFNAPTTQALSDKLQIDGITAQTIER